MSVCHDMLIVCFAPALLSSLLPEPNIAALRHFLLTLVHKEPVYQHMLIYTHYGTTISA